MYAADFGDRVEELYLGNCAALSPDTKSMPFTMPYGCAKVLGPKDPKIKAEIGGPETACLQQACLVHRLVVHWSPLVYWSPRLVAISSKAAKSASWTLLNRVPGRVTVQTTIDRQSQSHERCLNKHYQFFLLHKHEELIVSF